MALKVIGIIRNIQRIAAGPSVRERVRLRRAYGSGRWRKMKGEGGVLLIETDTLREAELHWYEAHGIGRREMKIKRFLDTP